MKTLIKFVVSDIIVIAVCFVLSPYYYTMAPTYSCIQKAVAVVHPTKNNSMKGKVTFIQEAQGVKVIADCSGLTPGKHGFHIHEFGDCGCDDFVCAGSHYNPTNQPHGGRDSKHRHVGDFGNLEADENGNAHLEFIDTHITLNGRNSIIGRSVIIHAKEDDLVTQPSGNSGDRIACGNIGIAEFK